MRRGEGANRIFGGLRQRKLPRPDGLPCYDSMSGTLERIFMVKNEQSRRFQHDFNYRKV